MVCTDKDKLAEIIANRVRKTCNECSFESTNYSYFCKLFLDFREENTKVPICKELFKEEVENENS